MKFAMSYYYKGSTNCYLHMKQVSGDEIQLSTDYGEVIKDVCTAYDLVITIDDLDSNKFA